MGAYLVRLLDWHLRKIAATSVDERVKLIFEAFHSSHRRASSMRPVIVFAVTIDAI
jgi:hypothetical protein